jgi:peptide/nickel transport system permease protein
MTETVFGWPGMGRLTYEAILYRDYPLLMGIFFFASIIVILGSLIADVVNALIDPRVRYD